MSMSRFFYTLIGWLVLPIALLRLWLRGKAEPGYRENIAERLGRYPSTLAPSTSPRVWLHCVSVGETRAAEPLVVALNRDYPTLQFVITHMTPAGRRTGLELFANRFKGKVQVAYLPYDLPSLQRRFLQHFQPALGLILETEIWPNLLAEAAQAKLPMLLVNARLSERSLQGYLRFATLSGEAVRRFAGVAAQTANDAARLTQLGAQAAHCFGNLKFDVHVPASAPATARALREKFGTWLGDTRHVLVCGSTREGEELLLLDALRKLKDQHQWPERALVVLVPRHPQRFAEVTALAVRKGFKVALRSDDRPLPPHTEIIIGDSMGEMFAYYLAADAVFIGGSLLFGGQNLIEAMAVARPVLIGPQTINFAEVTIAACEAKAALQVPDVATLFTEAKHLFANPALGNAMGQMGLALLQSNIGATEKTINLLKQHVKL